MTAEHAPSCRIDGGHARALSVLQACLGSAACLARAGSRAAAREIDEVWSKVADSQTWPKLSISWKHATGRPRRVWKERRGECESGEEHQSTREHEAEEVDEEAEVGSRGPETQREGGESMLRCRRFVCKLLCEP